MTIPIKATGSRYYKYSGVEGQRLEWLKAIVLEHKLYFPKLSQLNDPPDGRPKLALLQSHELVSYLLGIFLARKPDSTSTDVQKAEADIRWLVERNGPEKVQRDLVGDLIKKLDYRVYSLSKRYDNFGLWAKYADNHRGYCLEFAAEGFLGSNSYEVTYAENLPINITDPADREPYFLFCKRPDWSNEEEVRILLRPLGCDPIVVIEPHWLKRIILGKDMPEDHCRTICEWAAQRGPELAVMHARYDELYQELTLVSNARSPGAIHARP